jgi:hypothetical protein
LRSAMSSFVATSRGLERDTLNLDFASASHCLGQIVGHLEP